MEKPAGFAGVVGLCSRQHVCQSHYLLAALAGPPGAKKQAPKQNLFLIYVDALSLVNNKRAAKSAQLQDVSAADAAAAGQQTQQLQRQLSAAASAAPNMPDFTLKDLQFILTFTGRYWLF
jgi:hypothetical protein